MLCEICGKKDAVIDLTKVDDDEMRVLRLCKSCAAAEGVAPEVEMPPPLVDFLSQMGEDAQPTRADAVVTEPCEFCGLTFKDFRKTGRLGCPQCYVTFQAYLLGLFRRIHGGTQHLGKVYLPPDPTANELERRLIGLRRQLERAVDSEDFERAAVLRDEIQALERV